jgi:hypothetical protein
MPQECGSCAGNWSTTWTKKPGALPLLNQCFQAAAFATRPATKQTRT